ncbi:hypothetical protein M569_13560, partial [Genlisea aurea]
VSRIIEILVTIQAVVLPQQKQVFSGQQCRRFAISEYLHTPITGSSDTRAQAKHIQSSSPVNIKEKLQINQTLDPIP